MSAPAPKLVRLSIDRLIDFIKAGHANKEAGENRRQTHHHSKDSARRTNTKKAGALAKKGSRKALKKTKCHIIEEILQKWHIQMEIDAPGMNMNVTGELLLTKALEFRQKVLEKYEDRFEADIR